MIVADKKIVIDSPRKRIWGFLLGAVMKGIPLENMELVDKKNFLALLKLRIGFLALPLHVRIEITDTFEPETLVTAVKAKGMGGMIWLNQGVTFTLTSLDESKTEVDCKFVAQGMSVLLRIFLLRRVKRFARDCLNAIENVLREWTGSYSNDNTALY